MPLWKPPRNSISRSPALRRPPRSRGKRWLQVSTLKSAKRHSFAFALGYSNMVYEVKAMRRPSRSSSGAPSCHCHGQIAMPL